MILKVYDRACHSWQQPVTFSAYFHRALTKLAGYYTALLSYIRSYTKKCMQMWAYAMLMSAFMLLSFYSSSPLCILSVR